MKNPKVTVLMSVYNGEKYLHEAIDSILNQTFSDFEFIIVDDGSTDMTNNIIRSYKDTRIKVLKNPTNIGLTKSLNIGLQKAKGEYIARMDADDISFPERLCKEVNYLDHNPKYAVVGTFAEIIDSESNEIGKEERPTSSFQIKKLLKVGNCFAHGSVMIRKKYLYETGFYDETFKRSQDYDLWLRMAQKFQLANIPQYLYAWRNHRDNIENKFPEEQKIYASLALKNKNKKRSLLNNLVSKIF